MQWFPSLSIHFRFEIKFLVVNLAINFVAGRPLFLMYKPAKRDNLVQKSFLSTKKNKCISLVQSTLKSI